MKFNDNDIDALLNFEGNDPYGQYNQLQWSVDFGTDATARMSQVISVHEFFHSELNNTTVYGCLLQSYAYLSRGDSLYKNTFKRILNDLVQQCREVHEIYATWLSIAVIRQDKDDKLAQQVLTGNELYQTYYDLGNYLVNELPSLFLRQQVLTACIRFCFQSQTLAQTILGNLTDFTLSMVRSAEFPNQRFNYIREQLGPSVMKFWIVDYINQKRDAPEYGLLLAAINSQEDTRSLLAIENNYIADDLMAYVHQSLQAHFNARGSNSFDNQAHLSFFKKLLERLHADYPLTNPSNLLIPNQTPDDYERNIVINFENETISLADKPINCIIRHPHEITPDFKERLLHGVGDDPHLFIIGRLSLLHQDQYHFSDPQDQAWFDQLNGPFVAIRYSYVNQQVRIVVLIPFDSPSSLDQFLTEKLTTVPLLGCVAISAAYQSVWWQQWGEFFANRCQTACLLLDISPLHYVEEVLSQEEIVYYGKMIINTGERSFTALLFQAISGNQIQATLVAPCSDIYGTVLHNYIQRRFKHYQLDQNLTKIEYGQLPVVLSHLFKEERSFYFHSPNTQFL